MRLYFLKLKVLEDTSFRALDLWGGGVAQLVLVALSSRERPG